MALSNQVKILTNISTEVDESKLRIFFAIECTKAQALLLDKLKKKVKEGKYILNSIIDGNKKVKIEIKLSEQQFNNLIIVLNSITSGNIDLRKQLLLKYEENAVICKRIEAGEKKYEEMWLASNSVFENLPLVKQCLKVNKTIELIKNNIRNLRNRQECLSNEIKLKKLAAQELNQKRAIDVATFLVNDKPKIVNEIQERIDEIHKLTTMLENLQQDALDSSCAKVKIIELVENTSPKKASPEKKKIYDDVDTILLPKLQLMDVDLDVLGVKLDQIKHIERIATPTENQLKPLGYDADVAHSPTTFNIKWEPHCEKNKIYSDRKLIHILGDIPLGRKQTLNIISQVDPTNLQNVNTIGSQTPCELVKTCPLPKEQEHEPLKEIKSNEEQNVMQSSAQVMDKKKKKVSFNVQSELTEDGNDLDVNAGDGTLHSENVSLDNESDEDLQDKIHKLDATPEFVYTKHITSKLTEDKTITSKFFESNKVPEASVSGQSMEQITKIQENNFIKPLDDVDMHNKIFDETNSKIAQDVQKPNYQVRGLLFEHGRSQVMPDSLNATGFDADDSYPQLDSSVLLSPKANVAMDVSDVTAMAQVTNFMSGLRKTGGSFFERLTNDDKPNSSNTNTENNFNFNFGGEEKKKRGGFFNMFFNK